MDRIQNALTRVAQSAQVMPAQSSQSLTTEEPELPAHVEKLLSRIRTRFAVAANARDWDALDLRDYGRQVVRLTPEQANTVFMRLRDRHTFRPSVAEVRAVVTEVVGVDKNKHLMGCDRQARKTIGEMRAEREAEEAQLSALALPPAPGSEPPPPGWGRDSLRKVVAELGESMTPLEQRTAANLRRSREALHKEREERKAALINAFGGDVDVATKQAATQTLATLAALPDPNPEATERAWARANGVKLKRKIIKRRAQSVSAGVQTS